MEIFPKDLLLRVGGATLHRFGYPAVAGSRRGPVELPLTFARADASTCATYIDRDGTVRVAEANKLRREFVDLDGDGVRESPGLLLEGSRTNICLRSSDFANATWTKTGTPVTTTGETVLGALSLDLLNDDDGAAIEEYEQTVAYTGDGVKGLLFHAKAGTAVTTRVDVLDVTAATSRGDFTITWTAGVPGVVSGGGGTLLKSELLSSGVYKFSCQIAGVVAANTNRIRVFPAGATAGNTGTVRMGGMQTENAAFPSSLITTLGSAVTRAADSLTLPFNFGPFDTTILAKMARTVWADAVGTVPFTGVFDLGNNVDPIARVYFVDASRNVTGDIHTSATTDFATNRPIPAGATLTVATQIKNLSTGGLMLIDIGSGYGAPGSPATAFTAYGSQTLRVGAVTGGSLPLYGVLLDLKVFRGLFTYAEAGAVD